MSVEESLEGIRNDMGEVAVALSRISGYLSFIVDTINGDRALSVFVEISGDDLEAIVQAIEKS